MRPRQSADSDHRSASATASAGSCCVGSAVSPRVRDSHSLSGLLWLLSLYLGLHPVNNHARQCPTTVRTPTPSGPPASSPSTIYIYDLWCAPPGHPPVAAAVCPLSNPSERGWHIYNCCSCGAWSRRRG